MTHFFEESVMTIELYHTTSDLKTRFRKEKYPHLAVRIRAVYLNTDTVTTLLAATESDRKTLAVFSGRIASIKTMTI
jgi:hypothetical protein